MGFHRANSEPTNLANPMPPCHTHHHQLHDQQRWRRGNGTAGVGVRAGDGQPESGAQSPKPEPGLATDPNGPPPG